MVIVSNNAAAAIDAFLQRHHLTAYVRDVLGRPFMRPDLMKPHPHIVRRALTIAEASAESAVLIGDSVSDIDVARTVGVHSIGYGKTRRRRTELWESGADAVVNSVAELVG